jgi:hypothetical protein
VVVTAGRRDGHNDEVGEGDGKRREGKRKRHWLRRKIVVGGSRRGRGGIT